MCSRCTRTTCARAYHMDDEYRISNTVLVCTVQCSVMAAIKVNVCRFCGSTVLPKLCVGLFSKDGLEKDLPGRVSRVVDLPVSREDGLSPHLCRPCMRKFQAAEAFRSLVRSSYEKQASVKHPHPIPYTVLGYMALERGRRTPVALKLHRTQFKLDL